MPLSSTAFAGGDDLSCIGHAISLLLLPNAFSLALVHKKRERTPFSFMITLFLGKDKVGTDYD